MAEQKVSYIIDGKNLLSKKLAEINSDADKTEAKLENIGSKGIGSKASGGGSMLGSIAGGNLLASGISKATGMLVDFGKESVMAYSRFEQFQTALTTMFHGNKEEAKMLSAQLQTFAANTPYELEEVQQATRMMLAYGDTSQNVIGDMRMLGDVASGIGKPLNDIAYLYGTLKTQGRAYGQDIRQFMGAGIPIVDLLAKKFKTTNENVNKMVSDGKIGFKDIESVFKDMTSKGGQFFNMMEAQSKTLGGQMSNLSDAWGQLQVKVGSSQSGMMKSTVAWATDMVNNINKVLDAENRIEEATGHSLQSSRFEAFLKGSAWMATAPFTGAYGVGKAQAEYKGMMSTGNRDELMGLQGKIDKILGGISDKASGDMARKQLAYEMAQSYGKMKTGGIDTETLKDEIKMLNVAVMQARQRTSMGANANGTDSKSNMSAGASGSKSAMGSGTTITTEPPKNMYITINGGLVHEMHIESVNGDIPTQKIKEEISKSLLEVLNDADLAQR